MIPIESLLDRLRSLQFQHVQLFRFGVVGTLGFIIDTAVLYIALYQFGTGYYLGRLISYLCASTITWYLHRIFTFRVSHTKGGLRELLNFQIMNSIGGGANYLVYALLIANYDVCRAHPIIAVAIGALTGLFINYYLSKKVVFRV